MSRASLARWSGFLSKIRGAIRSSPGGRDLEAQMSIGRDLDVPSDDDEKPHPNQWRAYVQSRAWVQPLCLLLVVFVAALGALLLLYRQLPSLSTLAEESNVDLGEDKADELRLVIPKTFEELAAVRRTLTVYRSHHAWVLTAFLLGAQVFMLAFMIPGSVVISILAGSLYSFPAAVLLSTLGSTLGSGANYVILRLTLKDALWAAFPSRLSTFSREVRRHRAHLLYYMLFLRVTPLLPAWFINLAAPMIEIPLITVFLPATAIGHQPINIITAQAGRALNTLSSIHDLYSPGNIAFLLLVGLLALAPVAIRKARFGTGAFAAGKLSAPVLSPSKHTSLAPPTSPPQPTKGTTASELHEQ